MFFVMHCGGLSFNGDTIKNKSLGGSETAAYYVAKELKRAGHSVTLFTNSEEAGTFDGVKYEWAGATTDACPLGERFAFYAENTPHDVCIIQRHPRAFERRYASKMNFLWLHDLALYRSKDAVVSQMWNVDHILCVSEYHKAQVAKVYGLPPEIISVVNNAIDPELYAAPAEAFADGKTHLFYSSRPERGLINLVGHDGIMEKLAGQPYHLHVCGYENTTEQMRGLYEHLWSRCEALPNVTNHGALTKQELAALQTSCDAWVYPTEFEEVSCITAMEAQAAGCLIIASAYGALEETCAGDEDAILLSFKDGMVDKDRFIAAITGGSVPAGKRVCFTWNKSAEAILEAARDTFAAVRPVSLMHHFMRHSDIKALEEIMLDSPAPGLATALKDEYDRAYKFYRDGTYAEHYAAYYQYEKDRGVNYGPEDATNTARFRQIANMISVLPEGSRVLDYGCAHGHYTIPLAKAFPKLVFVGADIAQSNLDTARLWAADAHLDNVTFVKVDGQSNPEGAFDFIIAAEVVEHVGNPQELVDRLAACLTPTGQMVITVPYGPWEAQGYREHGYWRAHLHHFERADLAEMLGHHPNYKIVAAPAGFSKWHTPLGSYIVSFSKPTEPSRQINYGRKIMETIPDQTVTCCMIVKDAEHDIARCLTSVLPHVQEVVIGVDAATKDGTVALLNKIAKDNPLVPFLIFNLPAVSGTGFAAARNATLNFAHGDWILWIDSDEVLSNGQAMSRMLRNSMYNGFAVKQHHFSNDPVGVIKVDMPCRLFRNFKGIKFFGAVHEHPELKLNEGLGPVAMMGGAEIIHHGYSNERVRRKRFDRNLPLLKRDREELPDRLLGKFLWLRDLAQLTQYEIEANQLNEQELPKRIDEGIKLWLELLESKNYRMVLDALPYYSQLAVMRGGGLDCSFVVNANWLGEARLEGVQKVEGYFADKQHAVDLMTGLLADKLPEIDRRYA